MKKQYVISLIAVLLISGAAYMISIIEDRFPLYPFIDTEFTPTFSQEKFDQIQEGMSKEEVRKILGEPFWIPVFEGYSAESAPECWQYTRDGKAKIWDFAWLTTGVCFDENGTVIAKGQEWQKN